MYDSSFLSVTVLLVITTLGEAGSVSARNKLIRPVPNLLIDPIIDAALSSIHALHPFWMQQTQLCIDVSSTNHTNQHFECVKELQRRNK